MQTRTARLGIIVRVYGCASYTVYRHVAQRAVLHAFTYSVIATTRQHYASAPPIAGFPYQPRLVRQPRYCYCWPFATPSRVPTSAWTGCVSLCRARWSESTALPYLPGRIARDATHPPHPTVAVLVVAVTVDALSRLGEYNSSTWSTPRLRHRVCIRF